MRQVTFAITFVISSLACTSARADGDRLRLCERTGPWRVSIFESRGAAAMRVDFSVLVQRADSGAAVPGLTIDVVAQQIGTGRRVTVEATAGNSLHLFPIASCELNPPGDWQVEVRIQDAAGVAASVSFDCLMVPPLLGGSRELVWIGWPLVPIALYLVHQWRAQRTSDAG